jgi:putative ABC transport system permease protein
VNDRRDQGPHHRRGDRVYRWLLGAFPRDVRDSVGADMHAHVQAKRRAAAGKPLALARVWITAIFDALWHGLLSRVGRAPGLTTITWREHMRNVIDLFRALPALFSRESAGDVRLALRRLRAAPGFAAVALITMALGIGANTAIFSVVNAVLLTPLPFPQSDRLVGVFHVWKGNRVEFSPPNFLDVQSRATTLSHVAGYNTSGMTITNAGDAARLTGVEVSSQFFDVMATRPQLGRALVAADNETGHTNVAVLSYPVWQSRFGGRADIVGQTITLDGRAMDIVGVMPRQFNWPEGGDVWVPAEYDNAYRQSNRGAWYLSVVGRLAPSATVEQASTELAGIARQLELEYPINKDVGMTSRALLDTVVSDSRPALLVLQGAVALVLLIACVNVANLLLARSAARETEFALRAALGAGRTRLIRQLLVESLLLAGLGAALGLTLAVAATRALVALAPAALPRLGGVHIDSTVVLFTIAVAVVTGVIFGLVPAHQASRAALIDTMRERSASSPGGVRGRRTRSALVVAELALAVMLLVGAGLLVRSFARLTNVDPGFNATHGVTFTLGLPEASYDSDAKRLAFYDNLKASLAALPGATDASVALGVPPVPMHFDLTFTVRGWPPPVPGQAPDLEVRVADDKYFSLMGIPVLRGRGFDATDRLGAPPVVLLTESAVRRHFPNEDPIGKYIELGWHRAKGSDLVGGQVVGVVADVRSHGLDQEAPPQIYVALAQVPVASVAFVVRTATDSTGVLTAVREAVRRADPNLPVTRLETLEEHVSRSVAERRFYVLLLSVFAAVALTLAAVGIFGVLSYLVAQRHREIGIRMALGADRGSVVRLVLRQAMTSAVLGIAIGLVAAFALTGYMKTLLFELTATDPATFASVGVVLLTVSLVAAWLPARRAVRVDPTTALRSE